MLTSILARMSAGLPSSVKYKLKSLRRPYTSLMRLGEPILRVPTSAGTINWEVDELTLSNLFWVPTSPTCRAPL